MLDKLFVLTLSLLLAACSSSSNEPAASAAVAQQDQVQLDDPVQVTEPVQVTDPGQDNGSAQIGIPAQPDIPVDPDIPAQADQPVQDSIVTTDSGLQYEILRAAEGPKPGKDSMVTVDYVGTLTDGTEFDSSYSRGEPATFSLAQVIAGWTEGVQLMSVGSKYRFVIPSELAYGNRAVGTVIKPGDTLVFEVELLEINSI